MSVFKKKTNNHNDYSLYSVQVHTISAIYIFSLLISYKKNSEGKTQ